MNAEPLMLNWLETNFPEVRAVTVTPANLDEEMPLIRVSTTVNPIDAYRFEQPTLDLDLYTASIVATRDLTKQVARAVVEQMPGVTIDGVSVLSASASDLGVTPYDNTGISRRTLIVGLRLHDRSAS